MITLISAVTTSVIINVTTKVIATTAPIESSSSDPSSTVAKRVKHIYNISFNVDLTVIIMYNLHKYIRSLCVCTVHAYVCILLFHI